MALPSSNNEVTSRKLGSAISALWTKIKSTFAPVSTTVTNVAYDSTNKKLTKTINGTTSDIVTASTLKTDMSLNNVTNDAQVKRSEMGTASGVATLDANGIINTSQLPSYVDDVLEYSSKSSFPATGETGKIYVDTSTNLTWRWSGTTYVEISPSLALGETDSTAYRGDRGKTAYDHSQTTHARADATKTESSSTNGNIKINGTETTVYTHPTTTAVAAAAKKVGMDSTGHVVLGSALAASDVGLGNVDNKSEATIKSDFTGAVADENTGFPTGDAVYDAITANGKGIEIVTSSNTFAEVDAIYLAGKLPIYRFALPNTPVYFYLPMTGHPYTGTGSYYFSGASAINGKQLFYISLTSSGWGTLSEKTIVTEDSDLINLKQGLQGNQGTQIPANSDLNTYTTPGNYYIASAADMVTISNTPFVQMGFATSETTKTGQSQVTVYNMDGTASGRVMQMMYTIYSTIPASSNAVGIWYRMNSGGDSPVWGTWKRISYINARELINRTNWKITADSDYIGLKPGIYGTGTGDFVYFKLFSGTISSWTSIIANLLWIQGANTYNNEDALNLSMRINFQTDLTAPAFTVINYENPTGMSYNGDRVPYLAFYYKVENGSITVYIKMKTAGNYQQNILLKSYSSNMSNVVFYKAESINEGTVPSGLTQITFIRRPIYKTSTGAIGSSTRPVYVNAYGEVNACTYAISTSTTGTDTNTIYLV